MPIFGPAEFVQQPDPDERAVQLAIRRNDTARFQAGRELPVEAPAQSNLRLQDSPGAHVDATASRCAHGQLGIETQTAIRTQGHFPSGADQANRITASTARKGAVCLSSEIDGG